MKTYRTVTQVVDHEGKLEIRGVKIGEKSYTLRLVNSTYPVPEQAVLGINFVEETITGRPRHDSHDYLITVGDGGVRVSRHVYRPNHDHDNLHELLVLKPGQELREGEGYVLFGERRFGPTEPRESLLIPFGAEIVKY